MLIFVEDYISRSKQQGRKSREVMQVQQNAIEHTMLKYEVDLLIHGHTHKAEVSEFALGKDNVLVKRIALGGWLEGAGLALFYWENGACELKKIVEVF